MDRQLLREIEITEMKGLRIGNVQNDEAKTGVTVLLFDQGAKAGVDISGGGPAPRETPLASLVTADNSVNAIVLSGGSAFGLPVLYLRSWTGRCGSKTGCQYGL